MRKIHLACLALALGTGCAGTGAWERVDKEGTATALKTPESEIPVEVRAIERRIDTPSALIADEVEIACSRNYEWDVSLTGDETSPHRPQGSEHVSVAEGRARATFRNLDIRAHNRIIFRKSGFDVVPFIRITARGHAAYAVDPSGRNPEVHRGSMIRIHNADLHVDGAPIPVSAR